MPSPASRSEKANHYSHPTLSVEPTPNSISCSDPRARQIGARQGQDCQPGCVPPSLGQFSWRQAGPVSQLIHSSSEAWPWRSWPAVQQPESTSLVVTVLWTPSLTCLLPPDVLRNSRGLFLRNPGKRELKQPLRDPKQQH